MTESFHLYLTGKHVHARLQSGYLWRRKVEPLEGWGWDMAVPSSLNFDALALAGKRRPRIHIRLGAALAKFMAVQLPPGLRDLAEQRAAGQSQMQQQLGLNANEWLFTLDPAAPPGKTIVCAVRRSVASRIEALVIDHGAQLVSMKPFVAGVWNALQEAGGQSGSALLAIEEDAFTLLLTRDGVLESMSSLSHRGETGLVERELTRLAFSAGGVAQQDIRVAVPQTMVEMADAYRDKLLMRTAHLTHEMYADFRDLLFVSGDGKE